MSRIVWRQFATAVAVILGYILFLTVRQYQVRPQFIDSYGGLLPYLALWIPEWLDGILPKAAAIGVALLPMRAGAFRVALAVAGLCTLVMVGYDLLGRAAISTAEYAAYTPAPGEYSPPPRLDDTTGILRRTLLHLGGKVGPQDIQRWPPDTSTHPGLGTITNPATIVRISATRTYTALTYFTMPFILVGITVGLGAWLAQIATFRRERDGSVLRLVLGWVLALSVARYVSAAQWGVNFSISAWGQSMFWIFSPVLIAMVPAFLGWRAVWRLDRLGAE